MKKRRKPWQIAGALLGIISILYWLFLQILYGNIPFSIMFLLGGAGLSILSFSTWYWQISLWSLFPRRIALVLSGCILLCLTIFVGVEARILWDGHSSSDTYGDTILVLGAGLIDGDQISASLQYRLDKTIEVHKKKTDARIVVSGGQGNDETISEAAAMKSYLVKNGIDEELILLEERSTNTHENFKYSKQIMEAHGITSSHITLITNGFHMHRASYLGSLAGFEVERAPAKGLWTLEVCSYTREFFGVMRAYVLHY